jgi:hypothetical protein
VIRTYDIGVYDIGVYDIGVYDIGVYDIGVYDIGVYDGCDFPQGSGKLAAAENPVSVTSVRNGHYGLSLDNALE